MNRHRFFSLLAPAASLVLSACASLPEDPDPFDTGDLYEPLDGLPDDGAGPVVKNGTDPKGMFHHDILTMVFDLQWASLDIGGAKLRPTPTMDAAPPDVRKKVLGDLVRCALGAQDTLTDPLDGTPYKGKVGLAPTWRTGALASLSAQRFVSACLLQHLNGLGEEVWILLEGSTPALAPDAVERAKFSVTDSAIWGNLFIKPRQLYACALPDVVDACGEAEWIKGINKRICDSQPNCNLTLVGSCSAHCVESPNGLWSCPAWGYTEVVSSRTKPEDGAYVCLP